MRRPRSLQAFFDSELARRATVNLSASAAEPMTLRELFALEEGAREAYEAVSLDYPPRHGAAALRNLVAARYPGLESTTVLLSSGVDEALALLNVALVEPGDRVVVLSPCYPPQLALPRWRGAEVVSWQARPEQDWKPDLDELEQLLARPTRMVVATFPQNPTGFMPDAGYRDALLALIDAHATLLVADEIYAGLPPGDDGAAPLATRSPRAISLAGLSKTCGLPGLRIGWLVCPDRAVRDRLHGVADLFNAYLPAPAEHLACLALRHAATLIARNTSILTANAAHARRFFAANGNRFRWRPPDAGVLCFPRWLGPGGATALSDALLAEAGIAFAPSTCFDAGDAHLRLSLARRSLPDGLARLAAFLGDRD